MASGVELLRMLEPAVRPGQVPSAARPVSQPIESRPFDQLLDEAQEITSAEPIDPEVAGNVEVTTQPTRDLLPLGRVELIENASLRQLMAQTGEPGQVETGPDHTASAD